MTLIATLRERFLKRFLDTLRIMARTYAGYDMPNEAFYGSTYAALALCGVQIEPDLDICDIDF